ncbi:MAG: hypothetical protein JSW28_10630 [Thermoplasmata archaeon]|nr:MAG: hypothetical protein JSW28_10630 [Thermoplasmata archaeon]
MSINSTEAKTLENFVIHGFARKMERYPFNIPLPSSKKGGKAKSYQVEKWSDKPSSGMFAKPYKLEKGESEKIKEYDSELNLDLLPVNKMLMYAIPKKVAIGVWVRSRVEKFFKGEHEDDKPMTREELMTTLQTIASMKDAPFKIFAIYSVTGWTKDIWEKTLTPHSTLLYALIHEEIKTADINKFGPYKSLFPRPPKHMILPKKEEPEPQERVKVDALTRDEIEKVKRMLTEGFVPQPVTPGTPVAHVPAQAKTGWKERLADWSAPHSQSLIDTVAYMDEDGLKDLLRLIVTDNEVREFYICLVNKWNNVGEKSSIYYGFYEKTQIFEKIKGYVGMLYCLSVLLTGGEIQVFTDEIRYFAPILDFYKQADYAHNFPQIDSEIIKSPEGDRVTRYFRK